MLIWDFNEKVGEFIRMNEEGKENTYNLYVGNAYLIEIAEWEEDGKELYVINSFALDKDHFKNCLGLNKKGGFTNNIYNRPYSKLVKVKLDKTKCKAKEIAGLLIDAFDTIQIEII